MALHIADLTKPLTSAGRTTAKGHRIVLDDKDSHIQHSATGRNGKLHNKGNAFAMCVRIQPASDDQQDDTRIGAASHA